MRCGMETSTYTEEKKLSRKKERDPTNLSTPTAKRYLNKKEAAEYCGVSYNTLQKFIHSGLKVVMIDSLVRIDRHDIDDFFQHYKK